MVRCVGHQGSLEGTSGSEGRPSSSPCGFASDHVSRPWCVHPGGRLKRAPCRQRPNARRLHCSARSTVSGGFKT